MHYGNLRGIHLTITETHLRPQEKYPTSGTRLAPEMFVRDIVKSALFLKNGKTPGFGTHSGTLSFSGQKAKAVKMSDYSFPVFVIRKHKQRSSYSKPGEGANLKVPSRETDDQ